MSFPTLGTASSYAVLAHSAVTNTGPSTLGGDLGVYSGTAITGFPPGLVNGTIHQTDAAAQKAQDDVTTAYLVLAGSPCDVTMTGKDLGGQTLTKGVYCFSTSAQLTGTLILDAEGDPSAVFIFQIGSTLTTASNSSVKIIRGGGQCHVFWQVGSSATLDTTTDFIGNILALASITLNTNASLAGRALAQTGAVTLDSNTISPSKCENVCTGTVCGASCTDTNSDSANCGACGKACAKGESCNNGKCSAACQGTICGDSCVDLQSNAANCGACGKACKTGETCVDGACGSCCTNGNTVCQGAGGAPDSCANFKWDRNNCGACGTRCTATEMCTDSSCKACPAGNQCAGYCPDMKWDPFNCGACGKKCAPSESCVNGSCGTCSGSVCGGMCTELRTDPFNCGACGTVCATGECCVDAKCSGKASPHGLTTGTASPLSSSCRMGAR